MSLGQYGRLAIVLSAIVTPIIIHANVNGLSGLMEQQRIEAAIACVHRTAAWTHQPLSSKQDRDCWLEGDAAAAEAKKFTYIGALGGVVTALILIWGGGFALIQTARWVKDGGKPKMG